MAYRRTKHAKSLNLAHLIMVCKYRRKLLNAFGETVKAMLREIAAGKNIRIVEMEVDKDHVHLLIDYPPSLSLTRIVSLFKQVTTYRLWRREPTRSYLRKCFWNEHTFWSDGYFVCSIGNANPQTIRNYILNQG